MSGDRHGEIFQWDREGSPANRLLRAIYPEVDLPMADPVAAVQDVLAAREAHQGLFSEPSESSLPLESLSETRWTFDRHVETLYRSIVGALKVEPIPDRSTETVAPPAQDPIVGALRRVYCVSGTPELDPVAFAVHDREVGTPLALYRIALQEARLLDASLAKPLHLDLLTLHLEDPAPPADPRVDEGAWKLLQYEAIVYRGIHRARREDRQGAARAVAWIAKQPMPRDPLLLSVVAELRARFAMLGGTAGEIFRHFLVGSVVLQDEPDLQARLIELTTLRVEMHVARGEDRLADKTRRWLTALATTLDRQAFPALTVRIDRALRVTPSSDTLGAPGWPIVE